MDTEMRVAARVSAEIDLEMRHPLTVLPAVDIFDAALMALTVQLSVDEIVARMLDAEELRLNKKRTSSPIKIFNIQLHAVCDRICHTVEQQACLAIEAIWPGRYSFAGNWRLQGNAFHERLIRSTYGQPAHPVSGMRRFTEHLDGTRVDDEYWKEWEKKRDVELRVAERNDPDLRNRQRSNRRKQSATTEASQSSWQAWTNWSQVNAWWAMATWAPEGGWQAGNDVAVQADGGQGEDGWPRPAD
jgi:hypothetical protein